MPAERRQVSPALQPQGDNGGLVGRQAYPLFHRDVLEAFDRFDRHFARGHFKLKVPRGVEEGFVGAANPRQATRWSVGIAGGVAQVDAGGSGSAVLINQPDP